MKIQKKELIWNIISLGVVVLLIVMFKDFILSNSLVLLIAFLLFFVNYLILISHEKKYGSKNFPYKPFKSKKKIGERILIGLLAGIHYIFYIGNYNHKKYNTQIWYPETIECIFGNISQGIIFLIYILIAVKLFEIVGYYSLFFMIIPIITNIISIRKNK